MTLHLQERLLRWALALATVRERFARDFELFGYSTS